MNQITQKIKDKFGEGLIALVFGIPAIGLLIPSVFETINSFLPHHDLDAICSTDFKRIKLFEIFTFFYFLAPAIIFISCSVVLLKQYRWDLRRVKILFLLVLLLAISVLTVYILYISEPFKKGSDYNKEKIEWVLTLLGVILLPAIVAIFYFRLSTRSSSRAERNLNTLFLLFIFHIIVSAIFILNPVLDNLGLILLVGYLIPLVLDAFVEKSYNKKELILLRAEAGQFTSTFGCTLAIIVAGFLFLYSLKSYSYLASCYPQTATTPAVQTEPDYIKRKKLIYKSIIGISDSINNDSINNIKLKDHYAKAINTDKISKAEYDIRQVLNTSKANNNSPNIQSKRLNDSLGSTFTAIMKPINNDSLLKNLSLLITFGNKLTGDNKEKFDKAVGDIYKYLEQENDKAILVKRMHIEAIRKDEKLREDSLKTNETRIKSYINAAERQQRIGAFTLTGTLLLILLFIVHTKYYLIKPNLSHYRFVKSLREVAYVIAILIVLLAIPLFQTIKEDHIKELLAKDEFSWPFKLKNWNFKTLIGAAVTDEATVMGATGDRGNSRIYNNKYGVRSYQTNNFNTTIENQIAKAIRSDSSLKVLFINQQDKNDTNLVEVMNKLKRTIEQNKDVLTSIEIKRNEIVTRLTKVDSSLIRLQTATLQELNEHISGLKQSNDLSNLLKAKDDEDINSDISDKIRIKLDSIP